MAKTKKMAIVFTSSTKEGPQKTPEEIAVRLVKSILYKHGSGQNEALK